MTVAPNFAAMDAMLKASGFQVPASMQVSSVEASPGAGISPQQISQDQNIGVGQMKAETPETAAEIDNIASQSNGGLDSIREGLEKKAAALEGQALAASQPAAAPEQELSFAKYGNESAPLLAMAFEALTGGEKKILGGAQEASLADLGGMSSQSVGDMSKSAGMGRTA